MDRNLIENYLAKSGMEASQAETLSRILADMEGRLATKQDLSELKQDLSELKADLTWRMVAVVTLFGTVVSLVNAFIS